MTMNSHITRGRPIVHPFLPKGHPPTLGFRWRPRLSHKDLTEVINWNLKKEHITNPTRGWPAKVRDQASRWAPKNRVTAPTALKLIRRRESGAPEAGESRPLAGSEGGEGRTRSPWLPSVAWAKSDGGGAATEEGIETLIHWGGRAGAGEGHKGRVRVGETTDSKGGRRAWRLSVRNSRRESSISWVMRFPTRLGVELSNQKMGRCWAVQQSHFDWTCRSGGRIIIMIHYSGGQLVMMVQNHSCHLGLDSPMRRQLHRCSDSLLQWLSCWRSSPLGRSPVGDLLGQRWSISLGMVFLLPGEVHAWSRPPSYRWTVDLKCWFPITLHLFLPLHWSSTAEQIDLSTVLWA